ncbi:hypothetical protein Ahy_A02g005849 isoform A [Arachis hypogaea]|uniref:DUF7912 domain-containing protein n=1 Tax=Arachis hypogaea TaxID=3818 RepID=A0A445E7V3_ARAHY|nr:hypothetical protein Ahy_A02g005849 isoform A [Arachis hypogaea]
MSLELLLPLTLIDLTPSPPSSSRRRRRNELRSHCRYRTALFHHRAATVSALKTPSPGSPPTSVAQLCSIVAGAISVPPVSPSVVPLSPSCSRSALLCSRLLASRLETFDMETKCCTWGIADVRGNRGKGRPLNKKQREWRLSTPLSLRLVRLFVHDELILVFDLLRLFVHDFLHPPQLSSLPQREAESLCPASFRRSRRSLHCRELSQPPPTLGGTTSALLPLSISQLRCYNVIVNCLIGIDSGPR